MPLPIPKQRTVYGTYLHFAETGMFETFLRDYHQIPILNFQKIWIEGGREYWTCGQQHDPGNWHWKPWQHLERLCQKRGLDDFALRDILIEHFGRKLECECQILYDERELRKEALRLQFGVYFESGEVGLLDWDRNCRTVFVLISVSDLEFCPQITGWMNFRVGKESGYGYMRCRRVRTTGREGIGGLEYSFERLW